MGRMLMDPTNLNPQSLVKNFLLGYYGQDAAPYVRLYMDIFTGAIDDTNFYMRENFPVNAAFLTPAGLIAAMRALNDGASAASAVADTTTKYVDRVREVMISVQYVVLLRWEEVLKFAGGNPHSAAAWPFGQTQELAWDSFNATASRIGVTAVREGGCNLTCFHAQVFAKPAPVGCLRCALTEEEEHVSFNLMKG